MQAITHTIEGECMPDTHELVSRLPASEITTGFLLSGKEIARAIVLLRASANQMRYSAMYLAKEAEALAAELDAIQANVYAVRESL